MHRSRFVLSLLLLLPTGCASAPPPAPSAPAPSVYRSVHVDTLATDKVPQFEKARREWLGELRRANATDGRGVFLQVGDHRFYTLRSFAAFGDFDTRGDAIERSLAAVPKGAAERYDQGCDTALVFPHTSEIWRLDAELSYTPTSPVDERTAACGRFVLEDVRPDPASGEQYQRATAAIARALADGHYPLTGVGFRTVYGAGHVMTLWLAPSREVLEAAEPVPVVVARAVGPAAAEALFAARNASIVHTETEPLLVRHDLTQEDAPPLTPAHQR